MRIVLAGVSGNVNNIVHACYSTVSEQSSFVDQHSLGFSFCADIKLKNMGCYDFTVF